MTSHKKDNAVLDAIFNPLLPSYGGEVPEEQEEVEVEQVTQQNNQVQEDTTSSSKLIYLIIQFKVDYSAWLPNPTLKDFEAMYGNPPRWTTCSL